MRDAGRVPEAGVRWGRLLLQIAGFIFYLLSVQAMLTAGVGLEVYFAGGAPTDLLLPAASGLLAVCYFAVGYFLRRYRIGARNFAFAFAAVSLFAFPIGTILGGLIMLCIDRANRARVFGAQQAVRQPAPLPSAAFEEEAPLLRFEPEFAPEHAG